MSVVPFTRSEGTLRVNLPEGLPYTSPQTVGGVMAPNAAGFPDLAVEREVPASIPADEAYYWSVRWQQDVREAMADLRNGQYKDFDEGEDPNDVIRWLLSDED